MLEYLEAVFSGPVLPATVLLLFMAAYWLLVLSGMLGLDMFDFDLELESDASSVLGSGMAVLKFLNLGDVPVMLWLSVLALGWWVASVGLDNPALHGAGAWVAAPYVLRNFALGVVVAKLLTQPLRGKFDNVEPNQAATLIGRECVIVTSEATAAFGRAELAAEGAPLILNVRTNNGPLSRGRRAVIVDYNPERRVFYIAAVVEPSESATS